MYSNNAESPRPALTRPNALSVNEWVVKLTTTNEALAALSQELRLSPQEIKNMFIATVNSVTWTTDNAKFQISPNRQERFVSVMEEFVNNDIGCTSLNAIFPASS